ncbi:MAG: type II toxin-antitoxin system VapC family toxin [Deltaproteobacteria bacterium]|nr:type II toxin-antitoxin system VapC family toxin [Deltaproteobacteria bacterium]
MRAFVDTSAFLALLDGGDRFHRQAVEIWDRLVDEAATLVTSNYIVLETNAIVQRRLGMEALQVFTDEVQNGVTVFWVGEELHQTATAAQLVALRRQLSLVDCTSFQVMRQLGLKDAFTFDEHFGEQGFRLL